MPTRIELNVGRVLKVVLEETRMPYAERSSCSTKSNHLGGVPATAGFIAAVVVIDGLIGGVEMGGAALLRFAMICSFLRNAARRPRMPWTTMQN